MAQENATPEVNPAAIELNPQEEKHIKDLREREIKKGECAREVDAVLKKHGATIGVNQNSPIGRPEVIITI